MSEFERIYNSKKGSTDEALKLVRSGEVIVLGGDLSCPKDFASHLAEIAPFVKDVLVFKDFTNSFDFPRLDGMNGHINTTGFFFGKDMAEGIKKGNTSYFPSDLNYYVKNVLSNYDIDMVVVATSRMNENGDFQLGLTNMWEGEFLEYAAKCKKKIIVEANPNVPIINGGQMISIKDVTMVVETEYPFTQIPSLIPNEEETRVAQNVRELLKDGDCIQVGIGALPNAILNECMDLKDLGMHTEMITTQLGKMIDKGIINGERKNFNPKEHIFTFAGGTDELFDVLKRNKQCRIVQASYGCDPFVIMRNDNMISINTLIEMDLTGQICSEAVGTRQLSGAGGAFNYAYGALRSKGGKGIMAFTSRTRKGESKISASLREGAPVTVPRNYVDYVVTEYGIARLRGHTVKERAESLISIAHPDDREYLRTKAKKYLYIV